MLEVTALEEITPTQAADILATADPVNVRQLREVHFQKQITGLAEVMSTGRWNHTSGAVISFDRDGRLRDGYRRMHASVKAGVSFRTLVSRFVR
jgi:hypothetical protein